MIEILLRSKVNDANEWDKNYKINFSSNDSLENYKTYNLMTTLNVS